MCILCVIQKWSRRVATMLPWLVIPLIGLWALSQLLPPAFRFETTSPRLACVFVLLVTLFWYEVLMPQLSAWRVRRNARMRERKRTEAVELQKLRKTATRRCRNCLNPYRDQNPGGGRFMCSYCGHVSKRPVLDLPAVGSVSGPGFVRELVGKGGKVLSGGGRVWNENGWLCGGGGQDWLESGNWVSGKPSGWRMSSGGDVFGGEEDCLTEKSYFGALFFACRVLAAFFVSIRWLLSKVFRVGSSSGECSGEGGCRGSAPENGVGTHESRVEKARRKAEEKKQARLERELLEEEEKKQREEVARLVEERRKLRDEKIEAQAEKDHGKQLHSVREKEKRKEAERKRQERKKEKDKGSSKSNSDVEEVEKRTGKESERKREFDKKSETDRREHQKHATESGKGQTTDNVHDKIVVNSSYIRGSTGTRYFDRVRGSIFSSSKAFGFGRGANIPANAAKDNKFNSSVDHVSSRRDVGHPERLTAKSNMNEDDRNIKHSVFPEPQPWTAPKKSWQQLFTRSSSVPQSSNSNVICRPSSNIQAEVKSPQLAGQSSVTQSFDNPIHFGLPSPFNLTTTYPHVSTTSSLGFSPLIEPFFSPVGDASHGVRHEEQELFDDPCYVPDPISLLGPVSESLDDFQLDLGSSFVTDLGVDKPPTLKNTTIGSEVNNSKPSPIESPLSREKNSSNWFPSTTQAQNAHAFSSNDATANDTGTWQMWNSSPLGQEGLGLVGGPGSWFLPSQRNLPNSDDFVLPSSSQKTMVSLFSKDSHIVSSTHSPQNVFLPSRQSGGTFSPVTGSSGYDPWSQAALFPQLSGGIKAQEGATQNGTIYGSPGGSASNHVGEGAPVNTWSKMEQPLHGSVGSIVKPSVARTDIGPQHPAQGVVQSIW